MNCSPLNDRNWSLFSKILEPRGGGGWSGDCDPTTLLDPQMEKIGIHNTMAISWGVGVGVGWSQPAMPKVLHYSIAKEGEGVGAWVVQHQIKSDRNNPNPDILGKMFRSYKSINVPNNRVETCVNLKVAYTSGPIFEKIMKRYPIFSVQINNYQIDQKYK